MFEAFLKVWYFIIILPYLIAEEAWNMFRKYMAKRGLKLGPITVFYFTFFVLICVLLILFFTGNFRLL